MKIKIINYTFDKVAKTVTFTDYTSIRLDGVLLITNVMSNIIIYNFADPTKGGTVLTNVLTLDYDTSLMNNVDNLLIYYDDASVIQKVSEQSPLNISGLATITNQVDDATAQKQDDLKNLTSDIDALNRVTEDNLGTADLLLKAMDKNEGMPLNVVLPQNLKQEPDGGLYVADMKGPYIWQSSTASQQLIIDCTGFQSILVHKITTGVVTPYVSNDGKTWSATLAVAVSTTTPASTILTAAGMYVIPVTSKYLQLVGPASVIQCFIYLSQAPCIVNSSLNNVPMNTAQFGGYNVVTAGVNGMIAIGGNIAPGTAPTANPVLIGGGDGLAVPLTRRVLTDVLGRLQIGNIPSQRSFGVNILGFDPAVRNVLEVQDTSVAEGMEMDEVMIQILFELRILNQQMYELPRLLRDGLQNVDQPEDFRDDMGIFNQ